MENVKWRAVVWAVAEGCLICSIAINYLPPRMYGWIFKFSSALMMLDFFLCMIWLPIGVSRTYGFNDAKYVFTSTCMSFSLFLLYTRAQSAHRQWYWRSCGMELDPFVVSSILFVVLNES